MLLGLQANGSISGQLPASGDFFATQTFATPVESAQLEVWPLAVEACDTLVAFPMGQKQAWSMTMELTTTEGKTTGKALVPHLQVGEAFCFRVSWTELVAPPVARLEAVMEHAFDWNLDATATAKAIVAAAQAGFCGAPGKDPCSPVDLRALASDVVPLRVAGLEVAAERTRADARRAELDEAIATLEKTLPKVPRSLEATLPSTPWLEGAPDADAALQALETKEVKQALTAPLATEVRQWLTKWKGLMARKTALNAAAAKHEAEWAAKETVTVDKAREVAVAFVRSSVRARKKAVTTGTATSADFKNFLSPELGLALAQLFGPLGVRSSPRLVPYAAVNVYLRPVERSLGLGEVVHPFWQLVSFTLGVSLATPLVSDGVDLQPTVAGAYGLIGVGVRVLPFARLSALLFLAEAKRATGLSDQTALVAAGALALSADLDVVAFISSQLKK